MPCVPCCRRMAGRRTKRATGSIKLTPADAFDLIRWLARSQSDPRKAVAELVQNAIDARARTIVLERRRRGRRGALIVRDDGEDIRPSDEREAALRYLATHIGRSHKRNLSPAERHAQVIAGKYGIGLLGFWSIGRRLDIRSRVAGSATWILRLVEDDPNAEVVPAPPQIGAAETFTELVISEVHAAALRPLATRRLAEYLGAELRGPLSSSGTTVELREYVGAATISNLNLVHAQPRYPCEFPVRAPLRSQRVYRHAVEPRSDCSPRWRCWKRAAAKPRDCTRSHSHVADGKNDDSSNPTATKPDSSLSDCVRAARMR